MKLKSGLEVKLKELTLDERDVILDSIEYNYEGEVATGVKMLHSTITKVLRLAVEDVSDDFLLSLSFDEKFEMFMGVQGNLVVGEGKASDSK